MNHAARRIKVKYWRRFFENEYQHLRGQDDIPPTISLRRWVGKNPIVGSK